VADALQTAWDNREPDYQPRTRHLQGERQPKFTNRLFLTTSPYLRQHAHNPVNWFPWGDEAFARAKQTGRPILLSVGYSTCHWCHVMEEESFEDLEIATYLNTHYIAIKVDREQRPDVDGVYMTIVNMLTGRGGWPMTVIMTSDGKPFFGGTYFPPRDGARGRQKGFLTILRELDQLHTQARGQLDTRGAKVLALLKQATGPSTPGDVPGTEAIDQAAARLIQAYDPSFGGFSPAPKFPRPSLFEFLLYAHHQSGEPKLLAMVEKTLESMAGGGIHDQLGGGFHRYSTDTMWLVPHFEKMLYDNAQLTSAYIDAHRATGNPRFAEVARATLDYVGREMTDPAGGFYSATDADSQSPEGHREEGIFFTWTPAEIREVLPANLAAAVIAAYTVTPTGNFEGRSILHTPRPLAEVAASRKQTVEGLQAELDQARGPLLAARAKRTPPLRDDKIITSWNGLMISAFAQGALYLGRAADRDQAVAAGQFMWDKLRTPEGRLLRNFHRGRAQHMGILDDYACVIQGYLDLLSATSDTVWLTRAIELQATVEAQFADPQTGAYFLTANDAETLLTRERPSHDGAEPSANSVTARNLLRLVTLTRESTYRDRAHKLFAAFSEDLSRGTSLTKMLAALGTTLGRPVEVFIVSPQTGGDPEPLLAKFRGVFLPDVAVFVTVEGPRQEAAAALIPGLGDRRVKQGKTTAFVCEQGRCLLPTTDPEQFEHQLRSFQTVPKTP